MEPILLAIDPSIRSLGWAIVNLNRLGAVVDSTSYYNLQADGLWSYGVVTMASTRGVDPSLIKHRWKQAFYEISAYMDLDGIIPTHFASEWPTYFNSTKGRLAATQNFTVGLASMVGYLAGQYNFKAHHMALWTPMQWKGTVPKYVTRKRFVQAFHPVSIAERKARTLSDDTIDAIMIARYWLMLYHKQKFRFQHIETVNQ